MESIDYWRTLDELNIIQATLLILNIDPTRMEFTISSTYEKRPEGYDALQYALAKACMSKKIQSTTKYDPQGSYDILNFHKTMLKVDSLKEWMQKNNIPSKFFFPESEKIHNEFLNPNNPNYAPKLASAVNAWIAVSENPELARGKTIKQSLMKWLRENAKEYGLNDDEGKPSEHLIEEIAKIANWDTKGGAPKTPEEPKK